MDGERMTSAICPVSSNWFKADIRLDMQSLLLSIWKETGMTTFMVTHDISEAFRLGTRLLVFDKVRRDPQNPSAYGATTTYDLRLKDDANTADSQQAAEFLATEQITTDRFSDV